MRNARPDLNGLLVIDKPLGWTSFRACAHIRRHSGGAKVGHAGTLDPLATGVLVVCLGRATRHVERLMASEKEYAAAIDLSRSSPTHDLESEAVEVAVAAAPAPSQVRAVLDAMEGSIMQRPPAHSAVKVNGRRAYELARAGKLACATPDEAAALDSGQVVPARLAPRPVVIHAITITNYSWPLLAISVRCGKGTYIRSLARDIGAALGTGGVLTALVRTRSGSFTIGQARKIEDLPTPIMPGDLIPIPGP